MRGRRNPVFHRSARAARASRTVRNVFVEIPATRMLSSDMTAFESACGHNVVAKLVSGHLLADRFADDTKRGIKLAEIISPWFLIRISRSWCHFEDLSINYVCNRGGFSIRIVYFSKFVPGMLLWVRRNPAEVPAIGFPTVGHFIFHSIKLPEKVIFG